MPTTWSTQQNRIFEWGVSESTSGIVQAVAGSGKTTTLIELVKRMVAHNPTISIAFMAYNKAIAVEIGNRLLGVNPSRVQSGTFHSFGLKAWKQVAPMAVLDGDKIRNLTKQLNIPFDYAVFAQKAVSLAKQWNLNETDVEAWHAMIDRFDLADSLTEKGETVSATEINRRIEEAIQVSQAVLTASKKMRDVIDFDDMIYLPVVHRARVRQFDVVMIDEAQDTNPIRLQLARMMLKPEGRMVAIGDDKQGIYGFSGADSDSMPNIAKMFDTVSLPLSVTYRCPKAVVTHAQRWVTHITAADDALDGSVMEMPEVMFDRLTAAELRASDVVLCRLTAPLVKLAFKLIRKKIACHVEGRDIGEGLIALAKKWKIKTVTGLHSKLDAYREREIAKYLKKDDQSKIAMVEDKVDTLRVIMEELQGTDSVDMVVSSIRSIFGDVKAGEKSPSLTLSTVHRSKGREWDRVYLYGRNKYMPSRFAKQQWQREQENNLIYVAVTRAKAELIEVVL